MRRSWRDAWHDPAFRRTFWSVLLVALPLVIAQRPFFGLVGARAGAHPWDPLLAGSVPMDVSPWVFVVLYASILFTVARALPLPRLLLRGICAYVLLLAMRMVAMWLVALEAPVDAIPLVDPVTALFYPDDTPFLKDLFFSGHTATLALMVPLSRGRIARLTMMVCTALVAALVLVQHVHWTIDVFAAPVFTGLAWWASGLSLRLFGVKDD